MRLKWRLSCPKRWKNLPSGLWVDKITTSKFYTWMDGQIDELWRGPWQKSSSGLGQCVYQFKFQTGKSRLHDTTRCIQLDVLNFLFYSPCRATWYSLIHTTCVYLYHKSITFSTLIREFVLQNLLYFSQCLLPYSLLWIVRMTYIP